MHSRTGLRTWDPEPEVIVFFIALWSVVVAGIVGGIIGRAYERNAWQVRLLKERGLIEKEAEPRSLFHAHQVKAVDADPRELAQAIEAIAVEVERISEGQRFLTRVLSERDARLGRVPSPIPGSMRSPIPPTA